MSMATQAYATRGAGDGHRTLAGCEAIVFQLHDGERGGKAGGADGHGVTQARVPVAASPQPRPARGVFARSHHREFRKGRSP